MKKENTVKRLKDYQAPAFLAKSVDLTFKLSPRHTVVTAKIVFVRQRLGSDLVLNGKEVSLISARIDNTLLKLEALQIRNDSLRVPKKLIPNDEFLWEAVTSIVPESNTSLDGLYFSSGIYCTQCEAEGFRKITYFLDRPDVMSVYSVRIEGTEPILLSNGNLVNCGIGFAEWHDPWPKPSYLFALVAGNLCALKDSFTTKSGRVVTLKIYTKPNDVDKCSYAMASLKRAMKWDEEEYNREYDLDLFMIVAVDDFNVGAMENKGLNIFNSKYILADSQTATDRDYENIERIIAHEYFHNWTGNRITCRDWFQLCLKEGLTVFRDQQFVAAMKQSPIKRIEDVITLRTKQFREDDGPLAHPVRPEEYIEINNFYTATVYEKAAEIVRMLKIIVGEDGYRKAVQRFFQIYDGHACTVEDWIKVFEKTLGIDLKQFSLWYNKKGRPKVNLNESFNGETYTLEFSQEILNDSGTAPNVPMLIPINLGLFDNTGNEIEKSHTILLSKATERFNYNNLNEKPIPSLLRSLSAPITLEDKLSRDELLVLGAHDSDLFNRWDSIRKLSLDSIEKFIYEGTEIDEQLIDNIGKQLANEQLEPSFRALLATPPSHESIINYLAPKKANIDTDLIYYASQSFKKVLAEGTVSYLYKVFSQLSQTEPYNPDPNQSGSRALKLRILDLLCYLEDNAEKARMLFATATNMTDKLGSLTILVKQDKAIKELETFYDTWQENNNVIDKWFSTQAIYTNPKKSILTIRRLAEHHAFSPRNPNRFRSLIGSFASGNLCGFHSPEGDGYNIVTEWLMKLDEINPQTAAQVCTVFDNWKIFDKKRQEKRNKSLGRLLSMNDVSRNTFEIVTKILKE